MDVDGKVRCWRKRFVDVKASQMRQNKVKGLRRRGVRSPGLALLWITGGNIALVRGSRQSQFQEAILGRTSSDASEKGGLPIQKPTDSAIRIEEFKR